MRVGGVCVHVCAACGCETHIVCVITLNSVKIAHRWKVGNDIYRHKLLAGFDVDDSLYGNLALVHRLSTNDMQLCLFSHTDSHTLNTGSKYK